MSTEMIIIISVAGVVVLAIIAFAITRAVGVKQSQSSNWGNRHVKSSANGGKPDNAVGFLSEGNLALFKESESKFVEPLDPQLKELGVTVEDWELVQNRLRESWHLVGSKNFKNVIEELNKELFSKYGCVAVYAEYGGKGGQKAMTVYTQEVWNSLDK